VQDVFVQSSVRKKIYIFLDILVFDMQETLVVSPLRKSMMALFFLLLFLSFPLNLVKAKEMSSSGEVIIREINMQNIQDHVNVLSSCSSRVTGYPGCYEAAQYILGYLRNINGITVFTQNYSLMVPMSFGAEISIPELGLTFPAYPLWPNGIQTCSTPTEGVN